MRVLGTSVLVFEAIVMGLFIPVAYFTGRGIDGSTAAWLGAGLVVLCLVAAGMVTRPGGIALGWIVQILVIACGFVVLDMFVMGAIFAALWWAAVHYGRKVDDMRTQRDQAGTPDPQES